MTTDTAIGILSKDDIRAMREADRISFHRTNGETVIRCTKEVRRAGPFDEREKSYPIPCESFVRSYGPDDSPVGTEASCFALLYAYNETLRTVVDLLKAGDTVSLEWIGCANNGYLREANLCHDKLYLIAKRGDKRPMRFYMDNSVCKDNSARMVRPRGA